jgi:uncharacterized protein (DUF1330 family)
MAFIRETDIRGFELPKGYVIFTEFINDVEAMAGYKEASGPTMAAHGAKLLVVDPEPEVVEGEWPATMTVLLEFESVEAAKAWYYSDEYQAAAMIRQAGADTNAVILAGRDPQGG